MICRSDNHEGLEFVVSWSVKRILAVLVAVVVLGLATALLWIFLGTGSRGLGSAGFRSAGDRAGTGVLIGICVLSFGLTGMGGWIGLSWLIL